MRARATAILAVILVLGSVSSADAAIIQAENETLPLSSTVQTGSIDVFFLPDASLPLNLSAFQIRLFVDSPLAGLQVIGAGAPATHPYAFAPATTEPITSFNASSVRAADFLASGFATVNENEGLLRIEYEVAPGAFGEFRFALDPDPEESALLDPDGNPVPFTYQGGTITVTAVAIPEPAGAAALAILLAVEGLRRRRRVRRCERLA